MSNYSDDKFKHFGHHSCDKDLLWGYATEAEAYRSQNRMKDQTMINDWHATARRSSNQATVEVRKSFQKGREDSSIIAKILTPIARLFA